MDAADQQQDPTGDAPPMKPWSEIRAASKLTAEDHARIAAKVAETLADPAGKPEDFIGVGDEIERLETAERMVGELTTELAATKRVLETDHQQHAVALESFDKVTRELAEHKTAVKQLADVATERGTESSRLRALLAAVQWSGADRLVPPHRIEPTCPICAAPKPHGHTKDCKIAEALR